MNWKKGLSLFGAIMMIALLFLTIPEPGFAGEKEELELKATLIAEKERRLQAEWNLLQVEKKEIQEAVRVFQAKQKPPEKPEIKK